MLYHLLRNGATNVREWSVVAVERNGAIAHVALAARDQQHVSAGSKVPVYHMGPPLTSIVPKLHEASEDDPIGDEDAGLDLECHDISAVHIVAWIGDLSSEEVRVMQRWHRRVSVFFPSTPPPRPSYRGGSELMISRFLKDCRYIAHPPCREERDPVSGNLRALWFSCAGFVIGCYESAAVTRLVEDWMTPGFPVLDLDQIRSIWFPAWIQMTQDIAASLNLSGNGPWPVVVPGYVVNAFGREDFQVRQEPYSPSIADVGMSAGT